MSKQSRWQATVEIKVPFYDVDALRVVWHANYFKYFEIARCELLDSIDYNYEKMAQSGYTWPVIDVRARFGKPARFGDVIQVQAMIREFQHRLRIGYEIRNATTGKRVTRGSTTQVAVCLETNEMCYVSPPILLQKLGVTP